MVGIAAGMAKEGKNVFVTTYANFLAMRAYEQIRIQLGYMGFGVKVIGTGSGLAMGMSGNTHYGIEDIALMRAIPGLMVVSPADGTETTKVIREAAEYHGPVYIRLSGTLNNPIVYTEEYLFEFGKAGTVKERDGYFDHCNRYHGARIPCCRRYPREGEWYICFGYQHAHDKTA